MSPDNTPGISEEATPLPESQTSPFFDTAEARECREGRPPWEGKNLSHILLQSAPIGIFQTDVEGHCLYVNARYQEITGLSLDENSCEERARVVHPEDRDLVNQKWRAAVKGERDFSLVFRLASTDGALKWVHSRATPLRTPDGKIAGFGGTLEDVTELKKADEMTTFLATIVESSEEGIIARDMEGKIVSWNAGAERIYGYTAGEVKGRPISLLLPPGATHELPGFADRLRQSDKMDRVEQFEAVRMKKDGTPVDVFLSVSPIRNDRGALTGASIIVRDITAKKRMEAKLRQSEKLSAVGQLAAGVAHEINNPLGVILGFAQGMVRHLKPGDPLETYVKSIEREAIRCKSLVQDLLTFSRTRPAEMASMDLNQALIDSISLVKAEAKIRQVDIQLELSPALPKIFGNSNQVQQIIINLANNALDAMPEGGKLKVETRLSDEPAPLWVCLYVSDTGKGIPPHVLQRIFEPFFTTKGVGKGTGLGLSLVHEIVKRHEGTIDVQSRPGFTEFLVRFPIKRETK